MKQMRTIVLLAIGAAVALRVPPCHAVIIQDELYNSFALVNSDNTTPLAGDATAGDLVQVILTGPNNAINGPSTSGGVGGDDTILFTTHVGLGIPISGTGLLDLYPLNYSDVLAGHSNIFVRFWNGTTVSNSTAYGNSSIFLLPLGDAFNQSQLDFVPTEGSPHATDQSFSFSVIPEPSDLFLFGFVVFGAWTWKRRRQLGLVAVALGLMIVVQNVSAQGLPQPQDVWNSVSMFDATGIQLPGSNPFAPSNGCPAVPGCLVQILSVGSNSLAHVANLDGSPSGGDTLLFATVVGQGIDPCATVSGQFSTSFYPPPSSGTKIYARVFNAPTVQQAGAWGQSATFTTDGKAVMDLSVLGLEVTTMPLGINLSSTIDPKGYTYYQELIANTNPQDPNDQFQPNGLSVQAANQGGSQLSVQGHAGRQYTLQRTTDDLSGTPTWSDVDTTGVLSADATRSLHDSNPPATSRAFYRVKITMP